MTIENTWTAERARLQAENATLRAALKGVAQTALHLCGAYDDLLAAYAKPFGWGKLNSENVREAIARAALDQSNKGE